MPSQRFSIRNSSSRPQEIQGTGVGKKGPAPRSFFVMLICCMQTYPKYHIAYLETHRAGHEENTKTEAETEKLL
jgi:hypothetical protein